MRSVALAAFISHIGLKIGSLELDHISRRKIKTCLFFLFDGAAGSLPLRYTEQAA